MAGCAVNFCMLTLQREASLRMVKVGGCPVIKLVASLTISLATDFKLSAVYIFVAVSTLLCQTDKLSIGVTLVFFVAGGTVGLLVHALQHKGSKAVVKTGLFLPAFC